MNVLRFSMLLLVAASCSMLGRAQSSRLIAKANLIYSASAAGFVPDDTTLYYYSGSNGGDLMHPLNFDSAITSQWTGSVYANKENVYKTYTSPGVPSVVTDRYWYPATSTWGDTISHLFYSGGQVAYVVCQYAVSSSWVNYYKDEYAYASGNMVLHKHYEWDGTAFGIFRYQRPFTYSALTNNSARQADRDYFPGTFYATNQYTFTFPSPSLDSVELIQKPVGSSVFIDSMHFTYAFDAAGDVIARTCQKWNAGSGTWINYSLNTYSSFTTGGKPQNEIFQYWDAATAAYINSRYFDYTYNSYGQMLSRTSKTWNMAGYWEYTPADIMSHYYYGLAPLAAESRIATQPEVTLAPNPVSDKVVVGVKFGVPQPSTISFCDMQGKILGKWAMPASGLYTKEIGVNDLPQGTYLINIEGANGLVSKKLEVTH
jgi:hypothetical protein